MAIPSIIDGQLDKKGDINCSLKGSNQHFLQKCISTHYVLHYYKVSRNSVERFQKCCTDKLFLISSIFHFCQISKFKKGVIQRKKMNRNFLWTCTSTHYVLHYYKVSGNSVERFQRSCTDKLFGVVVLILAKFLS